MKGLPKISYRVEEKESNALGYFLSNTCVYYYPLDSRWDSFRIRISNRFGSIMVQKKTKDTWFVNEWISVVTCRPIKSFKEAEKIMKNL